MLEMCPAERFSINSPVGSEGWLFGRQIDFFSVVKVSKDRTWLSVHRPGLSLWLWCITIPVTERSIRSSEKFISIDLRKAAVWQDFDFHNSHLTIRMRKKIHLLHSKKILNWLKSFKDYVYISKSEAQLCDLMVIQNMGGTNAGYQDKVMVMISLSLLEAQWQGKTVSLSVSSALRSYW